MFAIVIYVTYPVQFFVAVDIFKPLLEERFDNKHILTAEYVLRVMLVLITCEYFVCSFLINCLYLIVFCPSLTRVNVIIAC